jgi:hypothetical protein
MQLVNLRSCIGAKAISVSALQLLNAYQAYVTPFRLEHR